MMLFEKMIGAGARKKSIEKVATHASVNTADLSSYSFPNIDVGIGGTERMLIIAYAGRDSAFVTTLSNVQINGQNATYITNARDTADSYLTEVGFYVYQMPDTATSVTVTVNWTYAVLNTGICVWTVTGADATPNDTTVSLDDPMHLQVDTVDNGFVTAFVYDNDDGTPYTVWTGLTSDYTDNNNFDAASALTTTGETPKVIDVDVGSGSYAVGISIAWKPV